MGLSKFLGVSVEGFEEEAAPLFGVIEYRWNEKRKNQTRVGSASKEGRAKRELKHIEC